jgi:hypothetical protein
MEINPVPSTYLVKNLLLSLNETLQTTKKHRTIQSLLWNRDPMFLKIGTNFDPHQSLLPALRGVSDLFKKHKIFLVISSLKDREHNPDSKHYVGKAVDITKKHLTEEQVTQINDEIDQLAAKVIHYKTHWHIQVD